MFVLTAEGSSAGQRNSWEIAADATVTLGRHVRSTCAVSWDAAVSRNHAEITACPTALVVQCLPGSRSPIWKNGQTHLRVEVSDGESFRIGRTWFSVTRLSATPVVNLLAEGTPEVGQVTSIVMNPTDVRLSLVTDHVSELWQTATEKELAAESLSLIQTVLNCADLLAVLSCADIETADRPEIVHWHKNTSGVRHSVNRDLISRSLREGQTAIEVDSDALGGAVRNGRWSFCVPVPSDAEKPWCIYIGGKFGPREDFDAFLTPRKLKPDVGTTELVAHLMGAIRSVRHLEDRFDGIRQFLSPHLRHGGDSATPKTIDLQPRETDVVAIYCDLRGFSRMVSKSSRDLHGLMERINEALGVITENISLQNGAIADFQGDSALGFWGWPMALANGPIPACRAALHIQQVFHMAAASVDDRLAGFKVGIGIASGRAIAGRIGTREHAKIGVFGPVVNIASRLEGLTKQTGASILMDETTAAVVRESLNPEEGRCRPLATVRPAGFDEPIKVSELLQPEPQSQISDADIENTIDADLAFRTGDWDKCRRLLNLLPADDRPRDFLLVQIAAHGYQPPQGWSGVIQLNSK